MKSVDRALVVLLVEDNPGDARLIREMMGELPNSRPKLTWVDSLTRGLVALNQDPFDVLLLDLSLPDSTGLDTVVRFRREAPNVPIVVLSGLDDEATATEAVHYGAQDYLLKGELDGRQLLRAMRYAVERERTRREVDALKSGIISMVSHELRTPITHIKGFASSLLDQEIKWDEKTKLDFIQEIDREADRLSELVSDILAMSRIESGEASLLEKSLHEPATLIKQAVASTSLATAEHVLLTNVPPDLPQILVDGSQIERVLINLIENAAKYSDAGTQILVAAQARDMGCEFSVTDHGRGISEEHRERVFEKFFRIRSEHAFKPGTGLGLAICKGIVEAHGGHIWVEAPAEGGSHFAFWLPEHHEQ